MTRRAEDHAQAEALLHHVVAQLTREAVTSEQQGSERLERRRRSKRRASRTKLGILLALFLSMTTLNVATGGVPDSWASDRAERDRRARHRGLSFAVEEIESYRYENGRIPRDLSELDMPEFGEWRYERRNGADYAIELMVDGIGIQFDSNPNNGVSSDNKGDAR